MCLRSGKLPGEALEELGDESLSAHGVADGGRSCSMAVPVLRGMRILFRFAVLSARVEPDQSVFGARLEENQRVLVLDFNEQRADKV